jgi:hypothetical protein
VVRKLDLVVLNVHNVQVTQLALDVALQLDDRWLLILSLRMNEPVNASWRVLKNVIVSCLHVSAHSMSDVQLGVCFLIHVHAGRCSFVDDGEIARWLDRSLLDLVARSSSSSSLPATSVASNSVGPLR